MPPQPPKWLLVAVNVLSVVSCVLLVMYLMNKLECNKFVRLTLAIQVGVLALAVVAYWQAGGFGS